MLTKSDLHAIGKVVDDKIIKALDDFFHDILAPHLDKRFTEHDKKFTAIDEKLDKIDRKLEKHDTRFEAVENKLRSYN